MAAEERGREVGGARNSVRSGTVLWGTGRAHFRQEILLNNRDVLRLQLSPHRRLRPGSGRLAGWLAGLWTQSRILEGRGLPFSPSVLTGQHKEGAKGVLCGCFHLVPQQPTDCVKLNEWKRGCLQILPHTQQGHL